MPLEALIFDVDGTLAETEETHRQALNETFAAFDLPWRWDQPTYRRLLNVMGGKERLRHHIEHDAPPAAGRALEALDELHAAKNRRYAELVRDGAVELRPGVERLIREARAEGVRLAIATSTSAPNVEALLTATMGADSPSLFETVAAGDSVRKKKPAPDVFRLALKRLGLAPGSAVALEDTVYGLKAASRAGLKSVATPSFYTDDQDFSEADAVFSSLGDPARPARHIAGAGEGEAMVTIPFLRRLVG